MATTVAAVVESADKVNTTVLPSPLNSSAVITVNSLEAAFQESLS